MDTENKTVNTPDNIKEASINDMEELKEMGFDLNDINKFNNVWMKSIQNKDTLEKLARIVFIEPPEKLTIPMIKNGLWDFFALCGVSLL